MRFQLEQLSEIKEMVSLNISVFVKEIQYYTQDVNMFSKIKKKKMGLFKPHLQFKK